MTDFDQSITDIAEASQADFSMAIAPMLAEHNSESRREAQIDAFAHDIRDRVLAALDAACDASNKPKITDAELPELFKTLDALAEHLYNK